MLDKVPRRMTPEEFYAWQEPMEEKYELVDGYPVPRCPDVEMMTRASKRHDRIVWNLIRLIGNQLGSGPCQGFTSDTAVRTLKQTRLRPDVGIECGDREDKSFEAEDVRFVAEVLSPSTRDFNMFAKMDEYRAIPTMRYVLLIESNGPKAILWSRQQDASWTHETLEGRSAIVQLTDLNVELKLDAVYGQLTFPSELRLVEGDSS